MDSILSPINDSFYLIEIAFYFLETEMDDNKEKALAAALGQIEKQFGKGSIMRLGDDRTMDIETVSTGSLSLDIALGAGRDDGVGRAHPFGVADPHQQVQGRLNHRLEARLWVRHAVAEVVATPGVFHFVGALV